MSVALPCCVNHLWPLLLKPLHARDQVAIAGYEDGDPQLGQRIGFDCARRSFAKTRKLGWRSRKVSSHRLKLLSADFDGLYDAYTRVSSSLSVTLLPAVLIAVCARWSSTRGNFVQLQVALPVRSFHWSWKFQKSTNTQTLSPTPSSAQKSSYVELHITR